MVTTYYVSPHQIDELPLCTMVSFSVEQAIIKYKVREELQDGSGDLNSVLPALLYQFDYDKNIPNLPSEDVLAHADLDYRIGYRIDLTTDHVSARCIRDMYFTPDVRLRELIITKTIDDLTKWMEKYRPVTTLDRFLSVNLKLMDQLGAAATKNVFSKSELKQIHADIVSAANLQEKLIDDYFRMENEIWSLRNEILKLKGVKHGNS